MLGEDDELRLAIARVLLVRLGQPAQAVHGVVVHRRVRAGEEPDLDFVTLVAMHERRIGIGRTHPQ